MSWGDLRLRRSRNVDGDLVVRFGVALLDTYLEFLAVRSRPNTVAAVAYDLKVFFTVVGKPPRRVVAADVLERHLLGARCRATALPDCPDRWNDLNRDSAR